MGYTHYWYRKVGKDFSVKKWTKFVSDCKKLHDHLPKDVMVQYEYDEEKPAQFDKDTVRVNGVGDDGHETFIIDRVCPKQEGYREKEKDYFDCCKTARKPYDLLVTSCLLLLKHTMPNVKVSSDGQKDDWQSAKEFVKAILPEYVLLGNTVSKIVGT